MSFWDGWGSWIHGWMNRWMDVMLAVRWHIPVGLCWLFKFLYWSVDNRYL